MSVVSRLTARISSLLPRLRTMTMPVAMPRPPVDEPAAKRMKMEPESAITAAVSKKKERIVEPTRSFRPLPDEPTAEEISAVEAIMAEAIEFPRSYRYELDYKNKLFLAPMVRTGTLPTRLLSLYYGAGLVWSPEIVDKAIIGAERSVDPETGVITYHKGQGAIFTTHPVEKPFLIFQIGSSNPELAVKAARVVAQDVSGIDLNCGCPKPFSTHSGMGAALLSTPDLLLDILRNLLQNIPLPISAKIRLMPTRAETMTLAARILKTGIRNLTVHCRTRDMRPREAAIHDRLKEVVELGRRRGVPVACNGDGEGWSNWTDIKDRTGADSLMIARAAERNPSCFAPELADATTVVVPQLLSWVEYTSHNWGNTKFLLSQFKAAGTILSKQQKKDAMQAVARGKTVREVTEGINAIAPITVSSERGKEFMVDLGAKLKERKEWNVWEECEAARNQAVAAMTVASTAPPETTIEPAEQVEAEEEAANHLTAAAG